MSVMSSAGRTYDEVVKRTPLVGCAARAMTALSRLFSAARRSRTAAPTACRASASLRVRASGNDGEGLAVGVGGTVGEAVGGPVGEAMGVGLTTTVWHESRASANAAAEVPRIMLA
ncbi:MAG TPA: hypothetical protein VFH14_13425 [Gemmatimonadaceae bacterium]|nr:hypothetical protein [Gemmatimonadaceae bacterium]